MLTDNLCKTASRRGWVGIRFTGYNKFSVTQRMGSILLGGKHDTYILPVTVLRTLYYLINPSNIHMKYIIFPFYKYRHIFEHL